MAQDESLRKHLVELLRAGHAHVPFEAAVKDWKRQLRGVKAPNHAHSGWEILEHLRIAQWDIVGFSKSSTHISPEFPKGYWPDNETPPDDLSWKSSVDQFRKDQLAMETLVLDGEVNLHAAIPHGDGQTILREAMMLAQHNSYHIGQLLMLRKILGI